MGQVVGRLVGGVPRGVARGRRGRPVGEVADPVGRLGDRRAQLLGPEPRDADGQVGLADRPALQVGDPPGRSRPVLRIVVDIIINMDVGPDPVAEVEVMRIGRHQGQPGARGVPRPPVLDRTADRPHPQGREPFHPAGGEHQVALPEPRAARRQGAAPVPGGGPPEPGVVIVDALEEEGGDVGPADLAEEVLGGEPIGVGHRQGQAGSGRRRAGGASGGSGGHRGPQPGSDEPAGAPRAPAPGRRASRRELRVPAATAANGARPTHLPAGRARLRQASRSCQRQDNTGRGGNAPPPTPIDRWPSVLTRDFKLPGAR